MSEPEILWSWSVVAGAAVLIVGAAYAWALWIVSTRRRTFCGLAARIGELGVADDSAAFTVHDDRHVLLVTSGEVLIADVLRGVVAQRFSHDEIFGLRIGEGGDTVEFRLLLSGGAESRALYTRSIVDFARLFQLMTRQDKRLEFILERP